LAGQRAQVLRLLNYSTIAPTFLGSYPEGQLVDRQLFYFPTPGTNNNPVSIPVRIKNGWPATPPTGRSDDGRLPRIGSSSTTSATTVAISPAVI